VEIYDVLLDIKSKLETIPDAKSVKIGLEVGIGSKDCPFIRIVSGMDTAKGTTFKDLSFSVVYGFDIKNKDLELMYKKMYEMEKSIIDAIQYKVNYGTCFFESNTPDGDKLTNLKSAIANFNITDIQ